MGTTFSHDQTGNRPKEFPVNETIVFEKENLQIESLKDSIRPSVVPVEDPSVGNLYDPLILRDCILLCSASYHADPNSFLKEQGHRFNCILVPNSTPDEGHFILAEFEDTLFLAVRGSTNSNDWIKNVSAWTTQSSNGGFVHAGWYSRSCHQPVNYILERLKRGNKVIVTGHSLGGAVAQLVTGSVLEQLAVNQDASVRKRITCFTFAAPLVFTGELAKNYNELHKERFLHFIDSLDAVPKILSWCQDAVASMILQGTDRFRSSIPIMLEFISQIGISPKSLFKTCRQLADWIITNKTTLGVLTDFVSYQPVGYYYFVDRPGNLHYPATTESLIEILQYKHFRLSPDLLVAHNMTSGYAQKALARLPLSESNFKKSLADDMKKDVPEVSKITLNIIPGTNTVSVKIIGKNLHAVKFIKSNHLNDCSLENLILPGELVSAELICLKVSKVNSVRSSDKENTRIRPVEIKTIFEPDKWSVLDKVFVHSESIHPLDECAFQELMLEAFYILIFSANVQRTMENTASRTLCRIEKVFDLIFQTVPARSMLLELDNTVGYMLLENEDFQKKIWNSSPRAREILRKYVSKAKAQRSSLLNQPGEELKQPEMDVKVQDQEYLKAQAGKFFCSECWNSLILLVEEGNDNGGSYALTIKQLISSDALHYFLDKIRSPLECAKAQLEVNSSAENYRHFLTSLALSLAVTRGISTSFGKFYNRDQTELGPLTKALDNFFANPYIRKLLSALQAVSGLSAFGYLSYSAFLFVTGVTGGWSALLYVLGSGLVAGFIDNSLKGLPRDMVESSGGLRNKLASHHNVTYDLDCSLGEKESKVVSAMDSEDKLTFESSESKYVNYLKRVLKNDTNYDDTSPVFFDIARRMKLLALSSQLRTELKQLPIVMLSGISISGKSTLREMILNPMKPNRANFGSRQDHRTIIPEIIICGSAQRTWCILDTIGLSDTTIRHPDIVASLNMIDSIFKRFATAVIIVVGQEEDSKNEIANEQAHLTSKLRSSAVRSSGVLLSHPTMTCFNKADVIFYGEEIPNDFYCQLAIEAEKRLKRDRPFDLRPISLDSYFPRVFSCFDPVATSKFPVEPNLRMNKILITPVEVQQWIENTFPHLQN
jgi:hypothetical protein